MDTKPPNNAIAPANNRNLIVGIVVAVVVLVVIMVVWPSRKPEGGLDKFRPGNMDALPTVEQGTREIIKTVIETPGVTSAPGVEGLAIPVRVAPMGDGTALRAFRISAGTGGYEPNILVVNEKDVVDIAFTAHESDADIFFPDFGVYRRGGGGGGG